MSDLNTYEALSLRERHAFATLVQLVGFAPQVSFGRGAESRVLRTLRLPSDVLYAVVPRENPNAKGHGVQEYRLLVAVTGKRLTKEAALSPTEYLVSEPPEPEEPATASPRKRERPKWGSPELTRKMRQAQRKAWIKRRQKYGPRGFTSGKEPWRQAQVKSAEVRRERKALNASAPEKPLRTF